MQDVKCPTCDKPIDAYAIKDGWCPECGKPLPAFIRKEAPTDAPPPPTPKPASTGLPVWLQWTGFAILLAGALAGGWFLGAVKRGELTGPAAIIPVAIYVVLAIGWVIESWRRRSRTREDSTGDDTRP